MNEKSQQILSEESLKEIIKCTKDVRYFAENYAKIENTSGVIDFQPFEFQKGLLRRYQMNSRNIVVSPRQMGISTCMSIFILWRAIFFPHKTIVICSPTFKVSQSVLEIIKFMYDELPNWIKPSLVKNTNKDIEFSIESYIRSTFISPDSIRGMAIDTLFVNNIDFFNDEEILKQFWSMVVMPSIKNVIVTSNTIKKDGLFYELYQKSLSNDNTESSSIFKLFKIDYRKLPGRNEKWRKKMVSMLGETGFDREYRCKFGDE